MMQRSQACVVHACAHSMENQKQLIKATIIGPEEAKIVRNGFCIAGAVMRSILSMYTQTHRAASTGESMLARHPAEMSRSQVIIGEAEVKAETSHLRVIRLGDGQRKYSCKSARTAIRSQKCSSSSKARMPDISDRLHHLLFGLVEKNQALCLIFHDIKTVTRFVSVLLFYLHVIMCVSTCECRRP